MAVAYTDSASMTTMLGTGRLTALLDRDANGTADTGVLDQAIAEAGALIDGRLARRYAVPFAAITDSPDTPDQVQVIARYLVAWILYKRFDPTGDDQALHFREADARLNDILAGRTSIPEATEVDAEDGLRPANFSAATPVFAGRDPETGLRRTRGL